MILAHAGVVVTAGQAHELFRVPAGPVSAVGRSVLTFQYVSCKSVSESAHLSNVPILPFVSR